MKSVCNYYKHQGLVFLQDLSNWNDWDGLLKSVRDAQEALEKDSAQFHGEHTKIALGRLVQSAESFQSELQAAHKHIHQALNDQITLQKTIYENEKHKTYFEDLYIVNPPDDMKRIQKKKGGLLKELYHWVLDVPQYTSVTDSADDKAHLQSRVLWVNGLAGMGKTMLMIGIIHELSDQPSDLAPSLSYYFCQGTDDRAQNSATAIIRSLVWMLLAQQPDLMKHLQLEHERQHRDRIFSDNRNNDDENALESATRVFQEMLADAGPVTFVVDALDECDKDLETLIELISTSLKGSQRCTVDRVQPPKHRFPRPLTRPRYREVGR